jgi:hypothetical protein
MRLQTALMAMIMVAGFSGGLRGEELPKLELGAIRKHWEEAIHHKTPHVPLVLAGCFKMTDGEKLFFLPLACHSSYFKNRQQALDSSSSGSLWASRGVLRASLPSGWKEGEGQTKCNGRPGSNVSRDSGQSAGMLAPRDSAFCENLR